MTDNITEDQVKDFFQGTEIDAHLGVNIGFYGAAKSVIQMIDHGESLEAVREAFQEIVDLLAPIIPGQESLDAALEADTENFYAEKGD